MYKLFLCLRYLRSRIIAYFAAVAVALCVAMMLIVISVMNGFLDKIERAAKGLFGDLVVSSSSLSGIGRYDEFIGEVTRQVPEVEAASPFILALGLLDVPGFDYRQGVQIAGIRLPERAKVTAFGEGLFAQRDVDEPTFDPPIELLRRRLAEHAAEAGRIYMREVGPDRPANPTPTQSYLAERMDMVRLFQLKAEAALISAQPYQQELAELQARLDVVLAESHGQYGQGADEISEQLYRLAQDANFQPPGHRIILGLGIPGLSFRTEEGETVRLIVPGNKVKLMLAPLGRRIGAADIAPETALFTVVDDCRTDVSSIDSQIVYVPFETLQRLNNMGAEVDPDDPTRQIVPPRCSQIHIKVDERYCRPEALLKVSKKVREVWTKFYRRYPDAAPMASDVTIETWRQRQGKIIGPIQQQRTLVVIMFGIISMVSVVLIFVIFYTIVVQKTRDIGVLKAVGASSEGVAQIFLGYGAAIGLVGAVLGCIGGYYFVRYINPIQDALDDWFGFRVWSREWFLFEKIPNQVNPATAVAIAVSAIVAGLIGALVPAIRAGRMQPVEALRYE